MYDPTLEISVRPFSDRDYTRLPELFALLEPELPVSTVISRIPPMLAQGWRCVGAYAGEQLIGMAGYSQRVHLFSGPVLYVENVAIFAEWQHHGVGARLMAWLEIHARKSGCQKVTLDAYAINDAARSFYQRLGYDPRGVHYVRDLA